MFMTRVKEGQIEEALMQKKCRKQKQNLLVLKKGRRTNDKKRKSNTEEYEAQFRNRKKMNERKMKNEMKKQIFGLVFPTTVHMIQTAATVTLP